jgi:choline dehydrogenase-like flavoprotein
MDPASNLFSERERKVLAAVAAAGFPAGKTFPAADEHTIRRVEQFFATQASVTRAGYRGLLHMIDAAAMVRHRRGFAALGAAQQLALMEAWRGGGLVRRSALRGLLVPLKMSYFDDPALYRKLGCAYERPLPMAEAKPAWFRERVHRADEAAAAGEALECDVVVVGTGAGGAVTARELAEAGLAVILLEEGDYHDRTTFAGRPFDNQRKLYRAGGATFSVGNAFIPIPLGRMVGGTTAINSGTCFRTPDKVLRRWGEELGLTDLSPERMAPYFDRVEGVLGVAPTAVEHLGGCARAVMRGADKLGYRHRPLARNAPDCDGQGVCCFGCPTDAKRSTNVSYVPMALRAGAELFTGARVDKLLFEHGRAAGVQAQTASGQVLTVRARAVVIACGTLITPVLLMRNGVARGSSHLGGNLSIHPAVACLAEMNERVASWDGVPQGYLVDEFADDGIMMEGVATPLEYTIAALSHFGPRLIELAEGFDRVASFGMMISDTSRGRVRLIRDRAVVTYNVGDDDIGRLKRGVDHLSRIFFAAGARTVLTPFHGHDELRSEQDLAKLRAAKVRASDIALSAHHPLGTARMGKSAATSVVDADHQVHGAPGLYVIDGSAVPTALGVNPQVTIMAMATRAAERLAQKLS